MSSNSSSDDCLALAKQWLHGCQSLHVDCRRPDPPLLPTRVIEVGQTDGEARILVTREGVRGDYAVLSHSWGEAKPTTLLKSNLAAMQRKLALNEQSKTFRDALHVTRSLGLRYLWIDSLCILQDKDDRADWSSEAPKMSTVYNSATVMLSAENAVDTTEGLFPNSDACSTHSTARRLSATAKSGVEIFVRRRQHHPLDARLAVHFAGQIDEPHLRSRGWCLQEQLLSPRILHFRKEELAWTCSTCSRCECRIRPTLPPPHPFRASPDSITERDKPRNTYELSMQWPSLVMDYTRRHLTYADDRVHALSGLANYMEESTTDTYYCGLWYEDLRFQLLWYVDRQSLEEAKVQQPTARFHFPYAPSWSWMSVPGPINYFERYPAGSAPRHPAIRSADAVEPLGFVLNVGRFPVDRDNLVGTLVMAPVYLFTQVLPVHYEAETGLWTPLCKVPDFESDNLRVYLDVLSDHPDRTKETDFFLVLGGRWVGQGMTYECMQAVCILARQLPKAAEALVQYARQFQMQYGAEVTPGGGGDLDAANENLPTMDRAYERIGLVRGAGSIKEWGRVTPWERAWLF